MRVKLKLLMAVLFAFGVAGLYAQVAYDTARSLVSRAQNDLAHARGLTHKGKERERFDNAQHSLSEFDKRLEKGKYDKDSLDGAVNDVKNVIEHNTLAPDDRDALTADLRDLRQLRDRNGAGY